MLPEFNDRRHKTVGVTRLHLNLFYAQNVTSGRLAERMGAKMWTEAHRACHEAGLKG